MHPVDHGARQRRTARRHGSGPLGARHELPHPSAGRGRAVNRSSDHHRSVRRRGPLPIGPAADVRRSGALPLYDRLHTCLARPRTSPWRDRRRLRLPDALAVNPVPQQRTSSSPERLSAHDAVRPKPRRATGRHAHRLPLAALHPERPPFNRRAGGLCESESIPHDRWLASPASVTQ